MGKRYQMADLGIKELIGRKVISAKINAERDLLVLDTDKGPLYLTWEGDCCAHCYLEHVSGVDALIGGTILSAENAEWVTLHEDHEYEVGYDVLESMGTNIRTDKGHISFETRVSHNGYYGGSIIVSDDEPMDNYSSPRYEGKPLPDLTHLKDF